MGCGRGGAAVLQRKGVTGKAEEKARMGRDRGVLQPNGKVVLPNGRAIPEPLSVRKTFCRSVI